MTTVLVVGARPASLGAAVAQEAQLVGMQAHTAGIKGEEYELDAYHSNMKRIGNVLRTVRPDHVVCTVGINMPEPEGTEDPVDWYRWHFETNVIGPMRLQAAFAQWISIDEIDGDEYVADSYFRHFVAISSNSARIPRTSSAAYCASKAALSMALRVRAREAKGGDYGHIVYGYEPGWLTDTPMSHSIESRFGPGMPMHRMRGAALAGGVSTRALASHIVAGLLVPGAALNGALIGFDGGEV